MDLGALFKISHGMYLTGATTSEGRLVGSCVDSVMVVEAGPCQVMISMNNQSYTREVVLKTGRLILSVLPQTEKKSLIRKFGTQSSRNVDKWADTPHHLVDGLPVYNGCVSFVLLRVMSHQSTPHHEVFLCEVVDSVQGTMAEPMTYAYYQQVLIPQKEEKMAEKQKKWVCTVCGYVYDGDIPFEQLPEDYICPLCGEPKSVFELQEV